MDEVKREYYKYCIVYGIISNYTADILCEECSKNILAVRDAEDWTTF